MIPKYFCEDKPQAIRTSGSGIAPIDGKIYWHLDEDSLTRDMDKYKILFSIEQGFNKWQPYFHKIAFEPTNDIKKSAIVIRFKNNGDQDLPVRFSTGVLAYAYFPHGTSLGIHSDIYLNDAYNWLEMHKPHGISLFKVFVHELGHSFGLYHSAIMEDIMYPTYQPNNNVVIVKDTSDGIESLYGKAKEDEPKEEPKQENVEAFIKALLKHRGEKMLKGINEVEVIEIAKALGLEASEKDLKRYTIDRVLNRINV